MSTWGVPSFLCKWNLYICDASLEEYDSKWNGLAREKRTYWALVVVLSGGFLFFFFHFCLCFSILSQFLLCFFTELIVLWQLLNSWQILSFHSYLSIMFDIVNTYAHTICSGLLLRKNPDSLISWGLRFLTPVLLLCTCPCATISGKQNQRKRHE